MKKKYKVIIKLQKLEVINKITTNQPDHYHITIKDSVGIMPLEYTPKYKLSIPSSDSSTMGVTTPKTILNIVGSGCFGTGLSIDPNNGNVGISEKETYFKISINRYNKLTIKSSWKLLNVYNKDGILLSLWENKQTKEQKEAIGTYPPSKLINLKDLKL